MSFPNKQHLVEYILNYSPLAIGIIDVQKSNTPFVYVNPAFLLLTEYATNEILGQDFHLLLAHDTRQVGAKILVEAIARGEGCRTVIRNYTKTNKMFWTEVTLVPVRNEERILTHCIAIHVDMTLQEQYNELQNAYNLISEQIAQLTEQTVEIELINTELSRRHEELQDLHHSRNELIQVVAHDLQNPLSAIMSYVEAMRNPHDMTEEDRQLFGEVAYETAERMTVLLRQLLDTGRLNVYEPTPFHLVPIDISNLAETLTTTYFFRAEVKGIRIEQTVSKGCVALGDEMAVYEVLDNLLSNALKYSPLHTTVRLFVGIVGENVRVQVQDEGQGLTDDDKQRIFSKYGRLSARPTGGEHSVGLGLAIVKKLVERMRGTIWVESEYGKGATFIVELPSVK
ncbi:MAG: PAS domain-containing protein [Candidatus Kapaibacterium sp.]|nr:MAG: PAS domain-containing protein [Candidatus Kapabacteria bacterium]